MLVNFEISSNPTSVSRPATATNHPRSGFRSFPLKLSQKSNQPFKIFQIQFQPLSLHLGLLLLLLLLLRLLFLLCGRLTVHWIEDNFVFGQNSKSLLVFRNGPVRSFGTFYATFEKTKWGFSYSKCEKSGSQKQKK